MSQVQSFYEDHYLYEGLTWSLVREQIGHGLRERYQVSKELPLKLLALIRKLEAIESQSPSHAHDNRDIGRNRRQLLEAPCAIS